MSLFWEGREGGTDRQRQTDREREGGGGVCVWRLLEINPN